MSAIAERDKELIWKLDRVLGGCVRKDTPLLTQGDLSYLFQRFQYLMDRVLQWEEVGEGLSRAASAEGVYGHYLLKKVILDAKNLMGTP